MLVTKFKTLQMQVNYLGLTVSFKPLHENIETIKTIKTFEQEKWQEQHPVTIHSGAVVAVDGIPVSTPREIALANIILRLNGTSIYLKEEIEKLKKDLHSR